MERVRRWFGAALIALVVGAIVVNRADLAAAFDEIGRLDGAWAAALAGLIVIGVAVEGVYTSSITPQLSVGRAVQLQQSVTAANNTVIGSGPVATGLRIAMMRSWGISDTSIGVSIVALNVVAATRLWLIALATAVAGFVGADGGLLDRRVYGVVIAAAVVVLVVSAAMWWVLLWHPVAVVRLGGWVQRGWARVRRRWRRVPAIDIVDLVERARAEAQELVRLHRWRIIAATIADQALSIVKPVAVVRAFGIGSDTVSTWQVVIAYGLVRLIVALTPIPGGVGVTEIGLAAMLVRFGGPETTVLAAVLTYRMLTFALPIAIGGVCIAMWRQQHPAPPSTAAVDPSATRCDATSDAVP